MTNYKKEYLELRDEVRQLRNENKTLKGVIDDFFKNQSPTHMGEPVVPKCPRIDLVVAVHDLASNFENSLYAFGDDAEARRKAELDIQHARHIAGKFNHNGLTCAR